MARLALADLRVAEKYVYNRPCGSIGEGIIVDFDWEQIKAGVEVAIIKPSDSRILETVLVANICYSATEEKQMVAKAIAIYNDWRTNRGY